MVSLKSFLEDTDNAYSIKIEVSGSDLINFSRELISQAIEIGAKQSPRVERAEEYLTRHEVAKILKVSLGTLWRWNNQKVLNGLRIGNKVRYKKSDIDLCLVSMKGEE